MNKPILYTFKDANRVCWSITVSPIGINASDPEYPDWEWSYNLVNEDERRSVLTGVMTGQYDHPPSVGDLYFEIGRQFNVMLLSLAQDAKIN